MELDKEAKNRQALLLGNGINQSYEGVSWNELLEDISVRKKDFIVEKMKSPMPLKAILLTNNNIKSVMKNKSKDFFGNVESQEQKEVLCNLLSIGFDDILTTNYSYELEEAAMGIARISAQRLRHITERTITKEERRYLLHTYNKIILDNKVSRIWHIHGESRKPDSMMLGHYWYGNMLERIKKELDKGKNQYYLMQNRGITIEYNSWVDAFILGDLYVLGFSFDYSELDLWWLLNRKCLEKGKKGRVIFYEMKSDEDYEKTELMKLFGVEVKNMGLTKPEKNNHYAKEVYKKFYSLAINDIQKCVMGQR